MEQTVFALVVAARFLLPLLIPRFPLPAIIACLILDGVDQTIFQVFGYDPPYYQSYDKAMDIFYLSVAYLAAMRNWDNLHAFAVARFLFYYRMLGAFLFEMTHERIVLLIFPNTFEYFFIAYEVVRLYWNTATIRMRTWILTAAAIWIFIKLPQEYWLHVAEMDVTDTLRDYPWTRWALVIGILAILGILWFVVRPRVPAPDHALRFRSDPMPESVDTATERAAIRLAGGWVWSWMTVEKVVLVGLISVIYAQILPGVTRTPFEMFVGIGTVVFLNAAITLAFSRRNWTPEGAAATFGLRLLVNVGLVVLVKFVLDISLLGADTLFFLCMISLITTLHDRYQPAFAWRQKQRDGAEPEPEPAA